MGGGRGSLCCHNPVLSPPRCLRFRSPCLLLAAELLWHERLVSVSNCKPDKPFLLSVAWMRTVPTDSCLNTWPPSDRILREGLKRCGLVRGGVSTGMGLEVLKDSHHSQPLSHPIPWCMWGGDIFVELVLSFWGFKLGGQAWGQAPILFLEITDEIGKENTSRHQESVCSCYQHRHRAEAGSMYEDCSRFWSAVKEEGHIYASLWAWNTNSTVFACPATSYFH